MSASDTFPSRAWWLGWSFQWRPFRGSDEWGRHTIVVPLLVNALVIATRPCSMTGRCAEVAIFACAWNGCPHMGMTADGDGYCPTHDPEWLLDEEIGS